MNYRRLASILLYSLFPAYAFFQMSLLNVLGESWQQTGLVTEQQLAYLSSAYFYADAVGLFFAGFFLDYFNVKRLVLLAFLLNDLGSFMLVMHQSLDWLVMARFISGLGHAFALLSAFRFATLQFKQDEHGFAFGLILTIALLGIFAAQYPFEALINYLGWQHAIYVVVVIGGLFWLVLLGLLPNENAIHSEPTFKDYLKAIMQSTKNRNNYLCSLYTCILSLPLIVMGMLWGNDYFVRHFQTSRAMAANASSMILLGLIIGFPVVGYLSDKLHSRRVPMFSMGLLTALLFLIFTFTHSLALAFVLLLLIGLFSSGQSLAYTVIAETNPLQNTSTSMGFANVLLMVMTASFEMLASQLHSASGQHVNLLAVNFVIIGLIVSASLLPVVFKSH